MEQELPSKSTMQSRKVSLTAGITTLGISALVAALGALLALTFGVPNSVEKISVKLQDASHQVGVFEGKSEMIRETLKNSEKAVEKHMADLRQRTAAEDLAFEARAKEQEVFFAQRRKYLETELEKVQADIEKKRKLVEDIAKID